MTPFEFIILFLSFIYTLALTHVLFAWTRMIRYRRKLVLSWPHLLWMLVALGNLAANWISLWDFRSEQNLSLGTIAAGFLLVILNYFVCALVSPDFEAGESYDMRQFHQREGPTYIAATLVLITESMVANFFAGAALNVQNWSNENYIVATMVVPAVAALLVKKEWVQILAPALILVAVICYAIVYYPVLVS